MKLGVIARQKTIMKSQCKLLKAKPNRKAFEEEVLKQYAAHFDHNGVSLSPPGEEAQRGFEIAALTDLFARRLNAQKHLALIRPDADERMGVAEKALVEFLNFHNNSLPSSGRWGRRDTTSSYDQALSSGKKLLRLALFHSAVPAYNEARILRYIEACVYWARFHVLVPFASKVWHGVRFAESKKAGPAADALRAENGMRLLRAQRFSEDPKGRAYSLIFFACMQHTEALVDLLFYMNTDAQEPERQPEADTDGRHQKTLIKAIQKRHRKVKADMGTVMDAMETHMAELWTFVVGQADSGPLMQTRMGAPTHSGR